MVVQTPRPMSSRPGSEYWQPLTKSAATWSADRSWTQPRPESCLEF